MAKGHMDVKWTSLLALAMAFILARREVKAVAAMRCCLGDCMRTNNSVCGIGRCQANSECVARYHCIHKYKLCKRCSMTESCPVDYTCDYGECILNAKDESEFGFGATIGVIFGVFAVAVAVLVSCLIVWRRSLQRQQATGGQDTRRIREDRVSNRRRFNQTNGRGLEANTDNPPSYRQEAPRDDSIIPQLSGPNEPPPFYSTIERTFIINGSTATSNPPSYEEALRTAIPSPSQNNAGRETRTEMNLC